ncbi:MAG: DUF202 domain-containing protein [Pirellula sp.]|jgi:putative membrane protein|nr:DUF202 domain-containing protein [Pirellula sp.]
MGKELTMVHQTDVSQVAQVQREVPNLDASTFLAIERTRVAYDRTLMAAVRTSTSLITFGFSVYKFFEFEFKERQSAAAIVGPREFGITMILIGLTLLVVSSYEYRRDRKAMQKMYPNIPRSTLGVIAGLIAGLGILALILAMFRH